MDELKDNESNNNLSEDEEFELSHTDKLVGIFTEPSSIFEKTAQFPPKLIDWFLPLLAVIVISILAYVVITSNPVIKYSLIEKQMKAVEERFDEMVKQGQLTEAQKEQQLEQTRNFMENSSGATLIFSAVGISISMFIMFFLITLYFFLVAKFGLKGEGGYNSAMVAYGLPYYILIIQAILTVILSLAFSRFVMGTSVAVFLDLDTKEFTGFLLSKVDPISIWFYVVFGIGLAKMFKSDNTKKYILMVLGSWLGFSIIFFFLAKQVSFLQNFIQ